MSQALEILNRQRSRRVHTRVLRQIILSCLKSDLLIGEFELAIVLLGKTAMAQVNQVHLGHEGCTDVITFDYAEQGRPGVLAGDILICVQQAEDQASELGIDWREEVVRYAVHGVLHLQGYDDTRPNLRKRMKARENELVRRLSGRFDCRLLAP